LYTRQQIARFLRVPFDDTEDARCVAGSTQAMAPRATARDP
jgi:hypothetical protein